MKRFMHTAVNAFILASASQCAWLYSSECTTCLPSSMATVSTASIETTTVTIEPRAATKEPGMTETMMSTMSMMGAALNTVIPSENVAMITRSYTLIGTEYSDSRTAEMTSSAYRSGEGVTIALGTGITESSSENRSYSATAAATYTNTIDSYASSASEVPFLHSDISKSYEEGTSSLHYTTSNAEMSTATTTAHESALPIVDTQTRAHEMDTNEVDFDSRLLPGYLLGSHITLREGPETTYPCAGKRNVNESDIRDIYALARIMPENSPMTMDYRPGRINIVYSRDHHIITSVSTEDNYALLKNHKKIIYSHGRATDDCL